MTKIASKVFAVLTLLAGLAAWAPGSVARAAETLTVVITDVGTGDTTTVTASGNNAKKSFNSDSFGNFAVSLTVKTNLPGQANPTGGTVSDIELTTNNTSSTIDTLTVMVTATGFTTPGSAGARCS